jgi:hypothetical protein
VVEGSGFESRNDEPPSIRTNSRENKRESAADEAVDVPTDSDEKASSDTLENKGGTPKDVSTDALEQAFAKALEAATAAGRWDIVERILAQVERRRG